jgi:hypothetical protein
MNCMAIINLGRKGEKQITKAKTQIHDNCLLEFDLQTYVSVEESRLIEFLSTLSPLK